MLLSPLVVVLVAFLPGALAGIGTFQISQPLQCGEMLLSWSHTGSVAATDYNLVLIPTSDQSQVLSNLTFKSTTYTYTLPQLPLSKGVEFIALLQDNVDGADGGRVSQVVKVADQDAGGTACLANLDHSLDGSFSVSTTTPTQCGDFSVTWEEAATGPVGITGLIPGGMSFEVPITDPSARRADWRFRVKSGSSVLFAMSTGGQKGSAGSSPLYSVGPGSDDCVQNVGNSEAAVIYSSLPVGDVPTTLTVYATLTVSGQATTIFQTQSASGGGSSGQVSGNGSSGSTNSGGSSTNVGAIAGGVVGGVAFLLLAAGLVWFCVRKRDRKRSMDEKAAANTDMTAAGRPWSPPLPSDPENDPIFQPTPFFGNGGGTGSAHNSMVGLDSPGTTHPSSNSLYNSSSGGGSQSFAPSAFSHVPPGGVMGSSSGGHGSESDGRGSMEKRGYPTAGSGSGGRADGGLAAPGALGEDSRRDSGTRFVRHEDAGALPASGEGRSPDEVVDLPPLYQDAGERASAQGH